MPTVLSLILIIVITCSGCDSRTGEGIRTGLNNAGDEVGKAAGKIAGAVRGDP